MSFSMVPFRLSRAHNLLRFELAIRGMISCSGYMSGQDQEPRLIKDNKMCWTTSECILLLYRECIKWERATLIYLTSFATQNILNT
jgi:hypothetical protein